MSASQSHQATHRIDPLTLSSAELERYSFVRALEAARRGDPFAAEFENELSREIRKRHGAQDGGPHRFFVPPQVLQQRALQANAGGADGGYLAHDIEVVGVLDALRNRLICTRMGAQRLTGLKSDTTYARQGGAATVTWQEAETTQAAETATLNLGSIALTPKTCTAYIEESRQLRTMAPNLAELLMRRELAACLIVAVDQVALSGSGASGVPLGLLNAAGIGTFNGPSVAYADVLEAQTDVLTANALTGTGEVAFVCRPPVASVLAQRQAFSALTPLWTGPLAAGAVSGCPSFSSMNIPDATLVAGDWSQLLLAEWGVGLEIRVNPYANFQAAINGYSAFLSIDVAVLHGASFSIATSVS